MSTKKSASPESIVREIKRKTRRTFTAEDKIPLRKIQYTDCVIS